MELATDWTAGSMTHTLAPILITVAEPRFSTPANSEVIAIIRNTAKVMPMSSAVNLARSFTRSLYAILRIPGTVLFPGPGRESGHPAENGYQGPAERKLTGIKGLEFLQVSRWKFDIAQLARLAELLKGNHVAQSRDNGYHCDRRISGRHGGRSGTAGASSARSVCIDPRRS